MNKPNGSQTLIGILIACLVLAMGGIGSAVWGKANGAEEKAHQMGERIGVVETEVKGIKEDVVEIKGDVKTLLRRTP